jgi:hypothetical protein
LSIAVSASWSHGLSGSGVASLQRAHRPFALEKFASCWSWRPLPGYHWKTTGSPSNSTRAPPWPLLPAHGFFCPAGGGGETGNERLGQNSVLRRRVRNSAGMRVGVSCLREAIASSVFTTALSSERRWPLSFFTVLRAAE